MRRTRCWNCYLVVTVLSVYSAISVASANAPSSSVSLPLNLPLSIIQAEINRTVPVRLFQQTPMRKICVPAKWATTRIPEFRGFKTYSKETKTKISPEISCDVSAIAERAGDITLSGADDAITVVVPIRASATAQGRGAIGQAIHNTARAEAIFTAILHPSIGPDWQLSADLTISYVWRQRPEFNLFGLIPVSIGSEVEGQLNQQLSKLPSILQEELEKVDIRSAAERVWQDLQKPIPANDRMDIHIRFAPQRIRTSGFTVTNDVLGMVLSIEGEAAIRWQNTLVDVASIPLPVLEIRDDLPERIALNIPLFAEFEALSASLSEELSLPIERPLTLDELNIGEMTIGIPSFSRFTDEQLLVEIPVEIRSEQLASAETLVVGLTIEPFLDVESKHIQAGIVETTLSRGGQPVNDVMLMLLFSLMKAEIESRLQYDFSAVYDELMLDVGTRREIPLSEFTVLNVLVDSVDLGRFGVDEDGISLDIAVQGEANLLVSGVH